ncbi:MAG: amidohydrolase family protein [Thalassobaculaceae bacterium]|mgnify:FL=1|jgi:dihydropyrimidinase|tara:strand:- start:1604 stop:3028 length:1425 start_codon:yes stop_codon:yes gene_type:complete
MFDLILRNGTVVTPHGTSRQDVAISGEAISAITSPDAIDNTQTKRSIDVNGKIVMPGGIDPHVHCKWIMPMPDGTFGFTEGPEIVSRAALYGGTTTLIDFAARLEDIPFSEVIEKRDHDWVGNCYCDYSYHLMLLGDVEPPVLSELEGLIGDGYPTIKIFTTNITPSRSGRMVHFGDIWEVFKVITRAGGLGVIHAEDNDLVMHMYEKLIREGRVSFHNLAEVHSALSEDLSFRRVIRLAEAEKTPLYMMHVSAGTGVRAIREARAKGQAIYGETLHQYMLFTSEDYKRPNGQIYHTYPSLKSPEDQAELWAGTLDGSINAVATDELCCTLQLKTVGNRIDDTTGGNAGVEPRLGVMYQEMVTERGYSLEQFVDLCSSNAAKIMGLYPRKGAIAAGSDADIAVLDPTIKRKVRLEDLHESDYSPWEGHEITAWPVMTILRGKIMVENGVFMGDPKDGKYLKRAIPKSITMGPEL